jgi:hypothetical protein
MASLDEVSGWLAENFAALLEKYKVPGAAIGVYAGGQVTDFAAWVLDPQHDYTRELLAAVPQPGTRLEPDLPGVAQ